MAWDDTKATNQAQSSVPADEKITSAEWNSHVTDQKNHAARHEAGGSDALTLGNLADMGAEAVVIDTATNRPAAGTADRLFVDLTNGRIERDDGSSWSVVASTVDTQLSEEEVDDFVANLVAGGSNVSVSYDDAGDTLTISATDTDTQTEFAQQTVTSDTTAANYDSIWADASSAAVTVTLPTPTQSYRVAVKAIDATNAVTVARNGTETINGSASDLSLAEGEAVTLESDGTNWEVV